MADFDDLDLDEDFDDLDALEEESPKVKAKKEKSPKAPTGVGASAVAEKVGANPKTFRAWLRRKAANGELGLAEREPKSRYTWANWKDPNLVAIMKAWGQDSHEKGGAKKEKAEKPAAKATATKATAKAPVKRARKAS